MIRLPPSSTRTVTLFPYTTPFRSEYMLTTMGDATAPGPLECSCGNVPDAARRRESRMRRVGSQEKLAAIRYRATALKICGDGSANIGRQRHDRLLPSLALNAELPSAPVDSSEEHTSELQSLMRHSYAVFCLK